MDENITRNLQSYTIFRDVSADLLDLIVEQIIARKLEKDRPFIKQYEPIEGLFFTHGEVKVKVDWINSPLSTRSGLFGEETCLLGLQESPVSCFPQIDCSAYFIPTDKLNDLLLKLPELKQLLAENMVSRTINEQLKIQKELARSEELRIITKEILDNIDEGTFSIDEAGEIGEGYTAAAAKYLGRKELAGVPFADVALRHDPEALRNYYRALHMIFDGNNFDPSVIIEMLPTEVTINNRIFQLTYSFVEDKSGFVISLFVRMEDLTKRRKMESLEKREVEKEQKERKILDNIRQNVDSFINLLSEMEKTTKLINSIQTDFVEPDKMPASDYIDGALRTLHATRGLTSQFELDGLKMALQNMEGFLQEAKRGSLQTLKTGFISLAEKYKAEQKYLLSLKEMLGDKIISVLKGITFTQDEFQVLIQNAKSAKWDDLKLLILNKINLPATKIATGWDKDISKLAAKLGKSVEFKVDCQDCLAVDNKLANSLNIELRQIYRNCLDHGIESPDIRKHRNKPPEGQLLVNIFEKEGLLNLIIEDDGAGFENSEIIELARKNKALDQKSVEAAIQEDKVWKILLLPGFSSMTKVTELSGRGVGLNAVEALINRLQGKITITSEPGRGTKFKITIPLNPKL